MTTWASRLLSTGWLVPQNSFFSQRPSRFMSSLNYPIVVYLAPPGPFALFLGLSDPWRGYRLPCLVFQLKYPRPQAVGAVLVWLWIRASDEFESLSESRLVEVH